LQGTTAQEKDFHDKEAQYCRLALWRGARRCRVFSVFAGRKVRFAPGQFPVGTGRSGDSTAENNGGKSADFAADLGSSIAFSQGSYRFTGRATNAQQRRCQGDQTQRPDLRWLDQAEVVTAAFRTNQRIYRAVWLCGLENQKGGFSRRHTLIRQLQDKGWNLLALAAGGLVRRTGKQAQIKYERAISALKTMEYTAVGFGPADLRLPPEEVLAVIAPTDDGPGPIVSANVGLFGIDEKQTARYRMAKAGDVLIGITTVLAASQQKQFPADNIEYRDPSKALAEVLPKLKAAKCQRLVLMVYGTREEAVKLANEFPDFDLAVVSGDAETPPAQPTVLKDSDTLLIELGYKGMYVGVLGVYDNPKQPIRYQRVPLDARFEPSKAMHAMMVSYQKQLGELGWNGLGLKPVLHESGREFIGSETCADCHSSAHEVFEKTPHAHALKTLMKLDPPRHFDPECVSCHVTGWQTQQYFPYETGYLSVKKTPEMRANGCENCHGPGQRHALAEAEDIKVTKDERAKLRLDLRVTSKEARDGCLKCHDLDNSPDFHLSGAFEKYWKKVKHRGKD